jgi:predicted enzyme related to lactoylglutathione lyase
MITEIAFTMYAVADMARARKFYEETLGLKPGEIANDRWMEYEIGPGTFAISTFGTPSAEGASIAFEVDNLDATIERLQAAGVEFTSDLFDTPVCRMRLVKDPDGNQLIVHQRKEGH